MASRFQSVSQIIPVFGATQKTSRHIKQANNTFAAVVRDSVLKRGK